MTNKIYTRDNQKRSRSQRRSERSKAIKNSLVDLTDAIWKAELQDSPGIRLALLEAELQIDISEGIRIQR